MGYYLVLGDVMNQHASHYKGLYRTQPCPNDPSSPELISLWLRYTAFFEKTSQMGIVEELSLQELFDLASMSQTTSEQLFEVIYFDTEKKCPHPSVYYGIDVTGVGGYSLLGEGLFCVSDSEQDPLKQKLSSLNAKFRPQLNSFGLFQEETGAHAFASALQELMQQHPGLIENENWQIVHVFSLTPYMA